MKITYTFLKPPRGSWALCSAQRNPGEAVPKMCRRTLGKWFEIPKHINEIQMVVSDRKIKDAVRMQINKAYFSAMYIATYLYNENAGSYEYTSTYLGLDKRLVKDFKLQGKGVALLWVYCNIVETL